MQSFMAELKLRELGELCKGNTEPSCSNTEGVTTRGEIKSSTSAGQPFQEIEERRYSLNLQEENCKMQEIKSSCDNKMMIVDNAQGIGRIHIS